MKQKFDYYALLPLSKASEVATHGICEETWMVDDLQNVPLLLNHVQGAEDMITIGIKKYGVIDPVYGKMEYKHDGVSIEYNTVWTANGITNDYCLIVHKHSLYQTNQKF